MQLFWRQKNIVKLYVVMAPYEASTNLHFSSSFPTHTHTRARAHLSFPSIWKETERGDMRDFCAGGGRGQGRHLLGMIKKVFFCPLFPWISFFLSSFLCEITDRRSCFLHPDPVRVLGRWHRALQGPRTPRHLPGAARGLLRTWNEEEEEEEELLSTK